MADSLSPPKLKKRASSKKFKDFEPVELISPGKIENVTPKASPNKQPSKTSLLPPRLESAVSFTTQNQRKKEIRIKRATQLTILVLTIVAMLAGLGVVLYQRGHTISQVWQVTQDSVQGLWKRKVATFTITANPQPTNTLTVTVTEKPDILSQQLQNLIPSTPPLADPTKQGDEELDKIAGSRSCIGGNSVTSGNITTVIGHPEIVDGTGKVLDRNIHQLDPSWCVEESLTNGTSHLNRRALNYKCIQSCADRNAFIQVADGGNGIGLICAGPSTTSCTFYADKNCKNVIGGSVPSIPGQGVPCIFPPSGNVALWQPCTNWWDCGSSCCSNAYSNDGRMKCHPTNVCPPNGWCQEARNQLWLGQAQSTCQGSPPPPAAPPSPTPPSNNFKCIQSCGDAGHYVMAKDLGTAGFQCAGPVANQCSWYIDATCSQLNAGGLAPVANTGSICQSYVGGWCFEAKRQLRDGLPPSQCYSSTTTVITKSTKATPAPPPPPVPGSAAVCIQSCTDKNSYVLVRDGGQGVGLMCAGPDLNTCTWFTDVSCSLVGPGSLPTVQNMGRRCTGYDGGWCAEAKRQIWDGKPQTECHPLTTTPLITPWKCIQSCSDKNHYVKVRDGGPGVGIQCAGPNLGKCSWFVDAACSNLTSISFPPFASLGRRCTGFSGGWCQEAQNQIQKGNPQTVCPPVDNPDLDLGIPIPQALPGYPTPIEPWFDIQVATPNYDNQTLVSGNNFGMSPNITDNWTPMDQAIRACRKLGPCRLTLDPGVYRFSRSLGIQFSNLQDFTFDGQGATLLFSFDSIRSFTAIPITSCVRCEFLNLNIDWDWNRWRLGDLVKIVDANPSVWTLEFQNWNWNASQVWAIKSLHPVDQNNGMSMGTRGDQEWFSINTRNPTVKVLGPRTIQLVFPQPWGAPPRGVFALIRYFTYETHCMRAQFVENVRFENIHFWGCAGKAMIINAGMSPIIVKNSTIAPDYAAGKVISATADGIFVARAGALKIEDVEITRNGDDCLNFHDNFVYADVSDTFTLRVVARNYFLDFLPGDQIELRGTDFTPTGYYGTITKILQVGDVAPWLIQLDKPLPSKARGINYILFNYRYLSQYYIVRNFKCTRNRARGVVAGAPNLILENSQFFHNRESAVHVKVHDWKSTGEGYAAGNALIRNNTFDMSDVTDQGYGAMFLAADFEGGFSSYPMVDSVTIINNTFVNHPRRSIVVTASRNVMIENNVFNNLAQNQPDTGDVRGSVYIHMADSITVRNNSWIGGGKRKVDVNGGTTKNILTDLK